MFEFATGDSEENAKDALADRGQAQKHEGADIVIDWEEVGAVPGSPYRAWTGTSTAICFGRTSAGVAFMSSRELGVRLRANTGSSRLDSPQNSKERRRPVSSYRSMMMVWGNVYNTKKEQSGSGGSNANTVDRVEWNPRCGSRECEITVEDIDSEDDQGVSRTCLTFWLTRTVIMNFNRTAMEDHNSIQFPSASSQETLEPLGILDDMRAAVGLVDDALLAARSHPPVIFGAGGPMLKRFDQSTASSRKGSQAPTPPRSVVGIGNKVAKPDYSEAKIVLAMVGLPARGKSYLSNKLMRYLKWLEYDVEVFNVGQLRRSRARQKALQSGIKEDHTAKYFSHDNAEATRVREKLAEDSLEMLLQWLKKGGNVAIHDATNSTRTRRAKIEARVAKERGIQVIFIESVCNDPAVIAANVALKVSSGDPDYKDLPKEVAQRDFLRRIKEYEAVYETITEPHLSYIRITDVGNEVTLSRINGYLQSRIAFYLMNLHVKPRSIFISRHGESQFNVKGKIGGDSPLSERGLQYARALPELVRKHIGDAPLTVWTSTLQRTIQTAEDLPYPKLTWKSLDELDAGVCDGMTYKEIEQAYPDDFANRDEDKFNYRYRGGESYRDVVVRLEPVIMELERQENILIFGHQAILRCLYAYFLDLPQVDLPYIKIPLHTVIKLTPKAYGCDQERYTLPIGAVDTHRPKPSASQLELPVAPSAREYYGKRV